MTEKQAELLEELREALSDMIGEVIALETFLRYQKLCEEEFGKHQSEEWLRRIRDYLDQHLHDAKLLTTWLLESAGVLQK